MPVASGQPGPRQRARAAAGTARRTGRSRAAASRRCRASTRPTTPTTGRTRTRARRSARRRAACPRARPSRKAPSAARNSLSIATTASDFQNGSTYDGKLNGENTADCGSAMHGRPPSRCGSHSGMSRQRRAGVLELRLEQDHRVQPARGWSPGRAPRPGGSSPTAWRSRGSRRPTASARAPGPARTARTPAPVEERRGRGRAPLRPLHHPGLQRGPCGPLGGGVSRARHRASGKPGRRASRRQPGHHRDLDQRSCARSSGIPAAWLQRVARRLAPARGRRGGTPPASGAADVAPLARQEQQPELGQHHADRVVGVVHEQRAAHGHTCAP